MLKWYARYPVLKSECYTLVKVRFVFKRINSTDFFLFQKVLGKENSWKNSLIQSLRINYLTRKTVDGFNNRIRHIVRSVDMYVVNVSMLPIMGIPASLLIFCNCWVKFLRASSRTVRWGAKQAMAHTRISTPVKNCLPRISHTPWFGSACCFVRPPYCSFGGGNTRPRTSIMLQH